MEVQLQDRLDNETVIFRVRWEDPFTNEMLSISILVEASLDEMGSTENLSDFLRLKAVSSAKTFARKFSDLPTAE